MQALFGEPVNHRLGEGLLAVHLRRDAAHEQDLARLVEPVIELPRLAFQLLPVAWWMEKV